MPSAIDTTCKVANLIEEGQRAVFNEISKRLDSLRRLAAILEELGDFNSYIPDLTLLVPILDINLDVYNQLKDACPFIGLPDSSDLGISELQNALKDAYSKMRTELQNSPYNRMGNLSQRLDDLIAKSGIEDISMFGSQFFACISAMCEAAQHSIPETSDYLKAQWAKQMDQFSHPLGVGTKGGTYRVQSGSVTYNGQTYSEGQEFTCVGETTEWTSSEGTSVYMKPTPLTTTQLAKKQEVADVMTELDRLVAEAP